MIKAIIFDMDGVVADYQIQDFTAWRRIFKEYGFNLSYDKYLSFLGMKGEEIIGKNINPNIPTEEALKIVNRKEKYFIEEIRKNRPQPTKGLKKLLTTLSRANLKIGLGTSAPSYKTNIVLKILGIKGFFNSIVTADEVCKGKPNPEIYLKVAKKLNVKPKECIVIEDAPKGIEAAKNAGMKCIAIPTTHKKAELKNADKIINSFNKLTMKVIESI
jgi:beta-phosphoglucomutase family hydrolase